MKSREIDLYRLRFDKNEHQQCFYSYQFGQSWYIDFYSVYKPDDEFWNTYLENLKSSLKQAKNEYLSNIKSSVEYNFAVKENKRQIEDLYNAINSQYKEATKEKLYKRYRTEEVIKLEAQLEILNKLLNYGTYSNSRL